MVPIVCVVGETGAGKTHVIEMLVAELKNRGYRVATIKHSAHGFDLDQPAKDSWRHAQAGSDAVVISSPQKFALIRKVDHDSSLAELSRFIGSDFDIILAEGFKRSKGLKVEVHHKELGELICDPRELTAVVSDEPLEIDIPQFNPDSVFDLAEFIEKRLPLSKGETTMFINGKPVGLSEFPQEFIQKTLFGMVSALKGIEEPQTIEIYVKKEGTS